MASWLARGTASFRMLLSNLQLSRSRPDNTMFALQAPWSRPFAASGKAGRPRKARSATAAASKATAEVKEKKPASAYALFMKDVFPKAKSAAPNSSFQDVSKAVSGQWKALNENDKAKYQQSYAAAKAAYDAKQPPKPPKAPKAPAKKEKAPKGPKKPATGYAAFVQQNFKTFTQPGVNAKETMKVLSGEWKKLSDAEKGKYK